ncbi:nuclear transport factor 2 family protein [Streptomyces sp. NPDC051662]|uniref:nuclear transport factor 2 family protein n=1 Tax=Streptomyces sp. NPDC051662 TaxID=3154750 RepID=UPI003417F33A
MSGNADLLRLASDLEARRAALLVSGDADALAGLLSEELYYAHSTGLLDDKQSFIEKFRDGAFVFRSVDARVESARGLGESAFQAAGVLELLVLVDGVERRIVAVYLVVWRQEEGAWRLVGHQATTAPTGRAGTTARSTL